MPTVEQVLHRIGSGVMRNVRRKLTAAKVLDARRRYTAGESMASIAREYGVSRQAMNQAVRGITWIGVGKPVATDPHPNGSRHATAKLTEKDVREARRLSRRGVSSPTLARRYGMSHAGMLSALIGRNWKHVPNPVESFAPPSGERSPTSKLTERQVREARRLWEKGHSQAELARRYGVHRSTLHAIVHQYKWPQVS